MGVSLRLSRAKGLLARHQALPSVLKPALSGLAREARQLRAGYESMTYPPFEIEKNGIAISAAASFISPPPLVVSNA